jgi:hypothetical protein
MLIFGLVLLVIGVLGLLAGIFGTDTESRTSGGTTDVHATFIGIEMSATTLFLVGVASATLVLLGLWLMKVGAKQGWTRRKEQKRLTELSAKLEAAEAERRREDPPGE